MTGAGEFFGAGDRLGAEELLGTEICRGGAVASPFDFLLDKSKGDSLFLFFDEVSGLGVVAARLGTGFCARIASSFGPETGSLRINVRFLRGGWIAGLLSESKGRFGGGFIAPCASAGADLTVPVSAGFATVGVACFGTAADGFALVGVPCL